MPPSALRKLLLVSGRRQLSAKLPARKTLVVALSEADIPTKPITDISNAGYYFRMWSATE
jgi:hypothetical protein